MHVTLREKPSVKVSPVDKLQEPVKEARVSPIKKEKVVEEVPLKHSKPERKSKKNGNKKAEYTNSPDDHAAVKIHLDKLKVFTQLLTLVYYLATCLNV